MTSPTQHDDYSPRLAVIALALTLSLCIAVIAGVGALTGVA